MTHTYTYAKVMSPMYKEASIPPVKFFEFGFRMLNEKKHKPQLISPLNIVSPGLLELDWLKGWKAITTKFSGILFDA